MRRIKEVLRLRYELKLDQRQIARSCSLSVSTVHEYLKRAEATNISWPLPDAWDDARVEAALFQEPESRGKQKKSSPDFAAVHAPLSRPRSSPCPGSPSLPTWSRRRRTCRWSNSGCTR